MKRTADLADLDSDSEDEEPYEDLIVTAEYEKRRRARLDSADVGSRGKGPTLEFKRTISQCTRTIEFKVGSDGAQEVFHVPEVLLVRVSDVLKDQLKAQLGKSTSTITLSYISPSAFSEFLFWLYHQDTHEAFGNATSSCYDIFDESEFMTCVIHLCILASNWKLVDIHNSCIEVLDFHCATAADAAIARSLAIQVYTNTGAGAPLRRYITMIIHLTIITFFKKECRCSPSAASAPFVEDLQDYLKHDATDLTWSDRCKDYHSQLFILGQNNEDKVLGEDRARPVSLEEYLMT